MFNRIPADMPVGISCWDSILVEDLCVIVMQPDNVFTEWLDRQPIGSIFQSRDSLHLHWWYWLKMRYKVSDSIWIYHFKNFNENCCIGGLIQCIVSKQWPLNIQKSLDTSFCNFIVVWKNIQAPNAVLMWLLDCSLSHPSLGWLYVFSSFPRPRPGPRQPPPQWLLLLTPKPFELDLRYLVQWKYRSGKMYLWVTLTQGHGCDLDKQKFACLQDKMTTTLLITTKLGSYIALVMAITWLDFAGTLLKILFLPNFRRNFGCVLSRSNTLLDISQEWLVRLMWNKKEVHWLDTGWTMWPWPLTSPMTLTFDFSRSNFKIAASEELLSDWCETKRKQIS